MSLQPSLDEMKAFLATTLGREVTISKVRVNKDTMFMVDYMNYSAPALKLVGESEEEAVRALFTYLSSVTPPAPDETSLPPAEKQL